VRYAGLVADLLGRACDVQFASMCGELLSEGFRRVGVRSGALYAWLDVFLGA
jgi:hypothetical protein